MMQILWVAFMTACVRLRPRTVFALCAPRFKKRMPTAVQIPLRSILWVVAHKQSHWRVIYQILRKLCASTAQHNPDRVVATCGGASLRFGIWSLTPATILYL